MFYQDSTNVCFIQKRAEMTATRYGIFETFAVSRKFLKKPLESTGLPANHERVYLHASMAWVRFTFHADEPLRMASNGTHRDLVFNTAILTRNRKVCEKRIEP